MLFTREESLNFYTMNTAQKRMIIVESPAKIKTITKYLPDKNYIVEASIGHIRDLPPKDIGIDIDNNFTPTYVDSERSKDVIKKLKKQLKQCSELYIATDPDREGEAIAWHIVECLKPTIPYKRLTFNEITKEAILDGLDNLGDIDYSRVDAQEARRILDRLFGFLVSKTLWTNVKGGLSAGRVQSPALKILVDKEKERAKFTESEYWGLYGDFASQDISFTARLISIDDKQLVLKGDAFDKETGQLKNNDLIILDQAQAENLVETIKDNHWMIISRTKKSGESKPPVPFKTSSLLSTAGSRLNFSVNKTKKIKGDLYNKGHITYPRTDSVALSTEALNAAQTSIENLFGSDYYQRKEYANKSDNAQEAHEAIRPSGTNFKHPDKLKSELSSDEFKLYQLIWSQTLASQMKPEKFEKTTMHISDNTHIFEAEGKIITFAGFRKAYIQEKNSKKESILPNLEKGDSTNCEELSAKQHFTKPTSRYTEPSLITELEKLGIGRPSTYATILTKILDKEYARKEKGALIPTFTGYAIVHFLEKYFDDLVNLKYTENMETSLDKIALGELDKANYLNEFYFGENKLQTKLEQEFDKDLARTILTLDQDGKTVNIKIGRYGIYAQAGDTNVTIDEATPPSEFDIDIINKQLKDKLKGDKEVGTHPETKAPIYLKNGKFGVYLNCEKKNKGLLPGMSEEDITPEIASRLIGLPESIGDFEGNNIMIDNGKFGPYIRCGKLTRSVPKDKNLLELTQGEAIKLLESDPSIVKKFKDSDIVIKKGRFNRSDYIQLGKVNASIPKGLNSEDITLEQAEELINKKTQKK